MAHDLTFTYYGGNHAPTTMTTTAEVPSLYAIERVTYIGGIPHGFIDIGTASGLVPDVRQIDVSYDGRQSTVPVSLIIKRADETKHGVPTVTRGTFDHRYDRYDVPDTGDHDLLVLVIERPGNLMNAHEVDITGLPGFNLKVRVTRKS